MYPSRVYRSDGTPADADVDVDEDRNRERFGFSLIGLGLSKPNQGGLQKSLLCHK